MTSMSVVKAPVFPILLMSLQLYERLLHIIIRHHREVNALFSLVLTTTGLSAPQGQLYGRDPLIKIVVVLVKVAHPEPVQLVSLLLLPRGMMLHCSLVCGSTATSCGILASW